MLIPDSLFWFYYRTAHYASPTPLSAVKRSFMRLLKEESLPARLAKYTMAYFR